MNELLSLLEKHKYNIMYIPGDGMFISVNVGERRQFTMKYRSHKSLEREDQRLAFMYELGKEIGRVESEKAVCKRGVG